MMYLLINQQAVIYFDYLSVRGSSWLMAMSGADAAHETPFLILPVLPPLCKSTIMSPRLHCLVDSSAGSSTAKGSVEAAARSRMKALVARS